MPLLAQLLQTLLGNAYRFEVLWRTKQVAYRIWLVGVIGAAYVACVVGWSTLIRPLLAQIFTTGYGMVLGLAFPPLAGTVVAAVAAVWGCIVAKKYTMKMLSILK